MLTLDADNSENYSLILDKRQSISEQVDRPVNDLNF